MTESSRGLRPTTGRTRLPVSSGTNRRSSRTPRGHLARQLPAIQAAALKACALDGVNDSLVEDPRLCHFDPAVLACRDGDAADCLTAPQLEALRRIYSGPKNPRTGAQIFPGYPPGTEAAPGGWAAWITSAKPEAVIQFRFGNTYYGEAVFENAKWDFRTLNFDTDVAFGDEEGRTSSQFDKSRSAILPCARRQANPVPRLGRRCDCTVESIQYYETARASLAQFPDARSDASSPVQDFYRLFMVPGMGHCGVGPNRFGNGAGTSGEPQHDAFASLEQWVEKGIAPEKICPYPKVARYNVSGDPNDAVSFSCVEQSR